MNPAQHLSSHLVDDDAAFRRSVVFLLESVGWNVVQYASAEAFLAAHSRPPEDMGCLLLDIRTATISGLGLQHRLICTECPVSIVLMSGHGDVEMAVRGMQAGACVGLESAVKDRALLDAGN